ncbi:glycosyltransferase family 2 protein [Campylobacter helveticus]|uniref:glycosyltransferase family 2 protein n=1 Tax=Campylobacter helveticus TaxID=28898 RepID=UPI00111727F5|nr:glycosyltransferase family 2 protein [Campylobacter helveticus]TNH36833.1 glycosyltransferase family 2 protein [Campylobacter helveticus]
MSVKVSVIIPSLNSINYYDECIKSVINQSLKEIEIICVDANSTDGTLELIRKYQAKDERIKLIISDKKSYGYQMNLGIAAAKGEYIGIVESDDYIDLDMYKELYALAKNKNVDILKSDIYNFYDKEKREFEYKNIAYDEGFYHKDLHFESAGAVCKNTALTKQEILKNSWNMNPPGLFSSDFLQKSELKFHESAGASYQDLGFWFITIISASRIYFHKKAYYYYRRDNMGSSCNSKEKVYCLCDEYDFIRKYLNKEKIEKYAFILSYLRFGSYCWNMNRIDESFYFEFLCQFQKDFQKIVNDDELDRALFLPWQLEILDTILRSPQEALNRYYTKLYGAIDRIKNQLSYKLGEAILKANNPLKFLKLPFTLISLVKTHQFEQKVLQFLIRLEPKFKPLDLEKYADYEEALRIKKHLSYRLGQALLKNPLTFIFKIPSIYQNFKKGVS